MEYFAWPLCVCGTLLILGLVVIFWYREEIGRLIDRTKSIGRGGLATTDAATMATIQQEAKEAVDKPSAADELLKSFDNQLLVEQENLIANFLNEKNIKSAAERERVLTRYLASSYIISRFEGIYQTIWGSQLRALEMLNASVPDGLPLVAVEPWYEVGKANYPAMYGDYTFEQWLAYMLRMNLLDQVAMHVHITTFGNEFLKYLVQNTYPMDKIG